MADGEGDDVVVGLEVGVARGLERTRQGVHDVPCNGGLLGDYECLGHQITIARPDTSLSVTPPPEPALPLHCAPFRARCCACSGATRPGGSRTCPPAASCSRPATTRTSTPGRSGSRSRSGALRAVHGEVGAFLAAALAGSSRAMGGVSRCGAGEADRDALATARRLAREGDVIAMFPEGTRRSKGLAEAPAGRRARRRRADRARGRCAARAGRRGRDRPARAPRAAPRRSTASRSPSTTSRGLAAAEAARIATERLMARIYELEAELWPR